jgi:hypothetical protein
MGLGQKYNFAIKSSSPPPGSYKSISEFDKKIRYEGTPSFGFGRENVQFGSFLQGTKTAKFVPSPNKYDIRLPYSHLGGKIGERLTTEPNLKRNKLTPGPG